MVEEVKWENESFSIVVVAASSIFLKRNFEVRLLCEKRDFFFLAVAADNTRLYK